MDHELTIENYLNKLKLSNLLRTLNYYESVVDFSSNDYLCLSKNEDSLKAGIDAARKFGTGSTGSRLLSGNPPIFAEFEDQIAKDKNSESALIFNSGYVANSSVISAFASADYLMIFDKLNHASMYEFGSFGSNFSGDFDCDFRNIFADNNKGKKLIRFKHLNYDHLEKILEDNKDNPRKFIASETVFGMDGDIANVQRLSELATKYGAILYLDEAHATGLYGKNGYGLSAQTQMNPENIIVMGTFSKSLASSGAYITCANLFKEYLIQVSKGFIYSTALLPFCIGVAKYNWELLPKLRKTREYILELSNYLRSELSKRGFEYGGNDTNIVPIMFETTEEMMNTHKRLLDLKIVTSAIRRPTSPTPRIKIAINAHHSKSDVDFLIEGLAA